MNDAGNFLPVIADQGKIAAGETPVTMEWDYLSLANRDALAGNPELEIVVPKTGVIAGPYAGAISAYAPHPNAAHLWWEFVMSDEGQLLYLKGYAYPIRYNDMAARGVIPADLAAKLPPAEGCGQRRLPDLEIIRPPSRPTSPRTGARSCTASRLRRTVSWLSSAPHAPTQAHDRTRGTRHRRVPLVNPSRGHGSGLRPSSCLPSCSCSCPRSPSSSGASRASTTTFTLPELPRHLPEERYPQRLQAQPAGQRHDGPRRGLLRLPAGLRRNHRRAAQGRAQLHADLLGRGLQFRRRAAGLCLRGHHGQRRPGHAHH